ncbi:MAG: AAA family ATPase, partial [Bdellovibrionia bacterium]
IKHIAKDAGEEYRKAFAAFFDENVPLQTRLNQYDKQTKRIYRQIQPIERFGHYHDERTMSTLLTYHDPKTYTFFKDSFYKQFCELLAVEPRDKGEKFVHYLELIDAFIEEYIVDDSELLASVNSLLSDDCFEDPNHKILAQDILYQMLDKEGETSSLEAVDHQEPAFWFVCQGHTLNDRQGKKYLFAPHQGSDGRRTPHWESMKKVREGDVVFNYADKALRGISFAKENSRSSTNPNPKEGGNNEGSIVDIDFFALDPPIDYSQTLDLARQLQRVTQHINSPFDVNGGIKQGYLFEFNREAATILRRAYGKAFPEPLESMLSISNPQRNSIMKFPLNTILYGPPGTGKTYNSIDKAVEIIDGPSTRSHVDNKRRFDELRQQGQIEFVTFHQNYAYEDFVVGLRPDVEVETLRFQNHKGIFYQMAKKARDNYEVFVSGIGKRRSFDEVFQELVEPLDRSEEVQIKMVSGISFWITEVSDKSISFRKQSGGTQHTLSISTLRDLVDEIRDIPAGLASYYIPLAELIRHSRQTTESAEPIKNFVLIIDEINRANISRVFGELITLLEEDKRLGAENELRVTLPNGEKEFGVPPNLFVIGTMNTADKSIALIDIALRRRFDFVGYYPRYDVLTEEAAELLRTINAQMFDKKKSADYLIGHAYLMDSAPIESILRNKVIPLLTEYFAGKTDIISNIFSGTTWSVSYNTNSFEWDISKE